MLESYEEGQKLLAEDFIDDYYMPEGKYQYCEIMDIGDDIVTVCYHGQNADDIMEWTRAEMEHMLGWDLGADDSRIDDSSSGSSSSFGSDSDTDEDEDAGEEPEQEEDEEDNPDEYAFF